MTPLDLNLQRILKSAVAWGIASIALRGLALVTTLPLVVRTVPPELYGMWSVFLNVAALVPAFDLCFGPTIGRLTAQILARRENPDAMPAGKAAFFDENLPDLLGTVRGLYRWLCLFVFLILALGGGAWVWSVSAALPDRAIVRGSWLIYCPVLALLPSIGFWRPFLYGLNAVTSSQIVQTVGQAVLLGALSLGLLLGWNLYALAGSFVLMNLVLWIGFRAQAARDPSGREYAAATPRIDRRILKKLWKLSWRPFINAIGFYLILNLPAMAGAKILGPATIASYALSFQLVMVCTQVSSLWMEVKVPMLPKLYLQDRAALHALVISRMRLLLLTGTSLIVSISIVGAPLLHLIHAKTTMLPPLPFLLLGLYFMLQLHHVLFESISVSFNYNPFWIPILATGVANCLLLILFMPRFGVWTLIACPLAAQAAFNNWWTVKRSLRLLGLSPAAYFRGLLLGVEPRGGSANR